MELLVERVARRQSYTIGRLYADGVRLCDTLEDADRGLRQEMGAAKIASKKVKGATAIPSGMLWRVTAKTSIVDFFQEDLRPSGSSEFAWRWGIRISKPKRKRIPIIKPTAAGTHSINPWASLMEIDGKRSDQTEAATITPEAKPSKVF